MIAVYILYSKERDKFNIGATKDFEARWKQHLEKHYSKSFTASFDDWEVFFLWEVSDYTLALKIEKFIKRMKSRSYIIRIKTDDELRRNIEKKLS